MTSRSIPSLVAAALVAATVIGPAQAMTAGGLPPATVGADLQPAFSRWYCAPPKHWSHVCIRWARGAPGTFAGPCIQSILKCVGPLPRL